MLIFALFVLNGMHYHMKTVEIVDFDVVLLDISHWGHGVTETDFVFCKLSVYQEMLLSILCSVFSISDSLDTLEDWVRESFTGIHNK